MKGELAEWLRTGLQNRMTPVRSRHSPPKMKDQINRGAQVIQTNRQKLAKVTASLVVVYVLGITGTMVSGGEPKAVVLGKPGEGGIMARGSGPKGTVLGKPAPASKNRAIRTPGIGYGEPSQDQKLQWMWNFLGFDPATYTEIDLHSDHDALTLGELWELNEKLGEEK